MNLDDLAELMGKTRAQVEELLKQDDVIELQLREKKQKSIRENGSINPI